MRVAIIGQGYVGLTIAVSAAEVGHEVTGFDVNAELVSHLNSGVSHIEGISDSQLKGFVSSGVYKASTQPADLDGSEVVVIAVPTPLTEARNPDLSFVHAAVELIQNNLKAPTLVINESTSYPGTLRKEIAGRIAGITHLYASSPERVDPGNTHWGTKNTPRLIGGLTSEAVSKAKEFYSSFCDSVIEVSSPEVAEAAKIFENTFRQVNIALVNEFAQIADALGISGREVLDAAATKPYGFMEFNPGPGVGGHCIPVDPTYLAYVANEVGVPATFIKRANEVNLAMPAYVVKRVIAGAGGLDYLTSDRDELKQKRDDLIYQLGRGGREKKAEAFIASETGPAIPGSDLELRRKADLEREAMGDVGQYDRNVQNVQPPTVTGKPFGENPVQAGVDAQKNTLKNADAAVRNLEQQAAREGRLGQLKEVKDLDVMIKKTLTNQKDFDTSITKPK